MSVKGVALGHFSTTGQGTLLLFLHVFKFHDVFKYFLLGVSKQDAATTYSHIKNIIELLKYINGLSNIWENIDGRTEH